MWRITQICPCIQDLKSCWYIPTRWRHLKTQRRLKTGSGTFLLPVCPTNLFYCLNFCLPPQNQFFHSDFRTLSQSLCGSKERRAGFFYGHWAAKGSAVCRPVSTRLASSTWSRLVDVGRWVHVHLTLWIAVHLPSSLLASKAPLSLP